MNIFSRSLGGIKPFIIIIIYLMVGAIGTGLIYSEWLSTQENIRNEISQVSKRQELFSAIHDKMGYGGFIHNFKNYLIRRNTEYYQSFINSKLELNSLVRNYRMLEDVSSFEKKRMNVIEAALKEYAMNIDTVFNSSKGKISKLDNLVKVDDSKALLAIRDVKIFLQAQSLKKELKLENLFKSFATKLIGFNLISFLVILIVSVYLFAMIDKFNTKMELSLHKHRIYMSLLELLKSENMELSSRLHLALDKILSYPIFDNEKKGVFFLKEDNYLSMTASYNVPSFIQENYKKIDLNNCAYDEVLEKDKLLNTEDFETNCQNSINNLVKYAVPVSHNNENLGVFTLFHTKLPENSLAFEGVDRYLEICSSIVGSIIAESRNHDELIKKKQISAVKDLIAKVAHEVNNPLMIAMLTYQKIKKTIDPDFSDELENLHQSLKRISVVTKEIQELSAEDKLVNRDNYFYKTQFFNRR